MMSEQILRDDPVVNSSKPNEIHLTDILVVLGQNKKLVIGAPIVAAAGMLCLSMWLPPIFTSTVKIMPPQQQQSSGIAAMLGQLGNLAGAGISGGVKSTADVYVGLLESRTIADRLISRFKLKEYYDASTMEETRKRLASVTAVSNAKKDGFLTVTTNDKNPQFAADLGNAYIEELTVLTQSLALTEASQRRVFFEKQLTKVKEELANAEVALGQTQEKTGMILPEAQVGAILGSVTHLKASIAAKEVQIGGMRTFASTRNPELLRAEEELRGLRSQLSKLEISQRSPSVDSTIPTAKIPEMGIMFVRRMRDVKYYETMFEMLSKQFELAKIDEAKDPPLVQLVDAAIPAEKRSGPKRFFMAVSGFLGGGILGVFLAFVLTAYRKIRSDGKERTKWQSVFTAWKKIK